MKKSLLAIVLFGLIFSLGANSYVINRFTDENGKEIEAVVVPGIPEALRKPGPIALPSRNAVILSDVPKLDWCYGCSATSAAMIAGFYDRNGYPNMYSGPTNGGVFPPTNSSWGYEECPLSATHQGYDGLGTWGHVNRFWTNYGYSGDDPYGSSNPTSTYENCTTDFMGTNQDYWNNVDGATTFFHYPDGSPLHNYSGDESASRRLRDGIRGFRLFMESRGYQVTTNYNQAIYGYEGNTQGYTLAQYRQSIDNGIPIMIHIEGHTMVGVGYESTNSTIYIHDTWDHNLHNMTWGGSYSGGVHYAVSVIELVPSAQYSTITWNPGLFSQVLDPEATSAQNLILGNSGEATLEYVCSVPDNNVLSEGFEGSSIPAGWTQQLVSGTTVNWSLNNGGISGNPASAYEGQNNAILHKAQTTPSVAKLISPRLNLSGHETAILSFMHAQSSWFGDQDELRVYYRTSSSSSWYLLATYNSEVTQWTQRTLTLPNLSSDYYIAFEGKAQYGHGVCLDEISVSGDGDMAPFLSINNDSSVSGSINPGAAAHVLTIGFDSSGLAPGIYQSMVNIISNSETNSVLTLPVSLTVNALPGMPQNISVEFVSSLNRNKISWNSVGGNVSGYRIYFCPNPDFETNVSLLGSTIASRLYFYDTAASSRTKGFYRVVAYR